VVALNENHNKKTNEEWQRADLPIVLLSPCSFVRRIQDLIEKTGD
jgi:hypothetical protein